MTVVSDKHISRNESGRTLLEMVIVLAISGILSMAVLKGYTWAMNTHQANDTMNEMEVRATTLATLYGRETWPKSGTSVTLQEFGTSTTHGFPITMTTKSDGMFVFAVQNVPVPVCEKMLKDWKMVEWLMVGGDDSIPAADSDHYFDFVDPEYDLCSKFKKTVENSDGEVVDMFFWFHRDLDLCQGDDCGNSPDMGEAETTTQPEMTQSPAGSP